MLMDAAWLRPKSLGGGGRMKRIKKRKIKKNNFWLFIRNPVGYKVCALKC